jgi:trigger factor
MSLEVSIEEVGPCRKELTVAVPAEEVTAEEGRVVRDLGRSVSIPGFRKGKIPASLVRQRFSEEIQKEVVDRLLPRYWQKVQEEHSLKPMLPPQVKEVGDLVPGEGLRFVAVVETRPPVELGELPSFDLPTPSVTAGDEEVGEALDDLRRQAGTWVSVERSAARGDRVKAEIERVEPAEEGEGKVEPQPVEFELGSERVWEELSITATGLSAGQGDTFVRRESPAEGEEGAEPTERKYRLTLTEVQERELPPLDDELAKKVGGFETLEELRDRVRQGIEGRKRVERGRERERSFLDQLRERYPLALPEGVVDREIQGMVNDFAEDLARRGVDVGKAEINWDEIAGQMRPQAEKRVHARLLVDALADRDGVEVKPDDLQRGLAILAQSQGTTVPALHSALGPERLERLSEELRREKTMKQYLRDEELEAAEAAQDAEEESAPGEADASEE